MHIYTHIRAGVGEASKQEGAKDYSLEAPSLEAASLEEPVQGGARRANPPTRADFEMSVGMDRTTDRTMSQSMSQSETLFMPSFGTQENVDYLLQACSVLGVGRSGLVPGCATLGGDYQPTSRVLGNAEEKDEVLEERGAQEKGVREVMARKAERETGMKKKVGEEAEEEARHPESLYRCAKCKENHKGFLYCMQMGHMCAAVQGSKRTDTRTVMFKCPNAAEILKKSAPFVYSIQSRYSADIFRISEDRQTQSDVQVSRRVWIAVCLGCKVLRSLAQKSHGYMLPAVHHWWHRRGEWERERST